jgi:hypothetical protein
MTAPSHGQAKLLDGGSIQFTFAYPNGDQSASVCTNAVMPFRKSCRQQLTVRGVSLERRCGSP